MMPDSPRTVRSGGRGCDWLRGPPVAERSPGGTAVRSISARRAVIPVLAEAASVEFKVLLHLSGLPKSQMFDLVERDCPWSNSACFDRRDMGLIRA